VEVRLFGELEAADGGVAPAVRGVKQRAELGIDPAPAPAAAGRLRER
jgi:hypothetical protein